MSLSCGQPSVSYHQKGAAVGLPVPSAHVANGSGIVRTSVPVVADTSSRYTGMGKPTAAAEALYDESPRRRTTMLPGANATGE